MSQSMIRKDGKDRMDTLGRVVQASSSSDGSRRGLWATPRTPTGGPESAQRKQELGRKTSGGGDLASQASGKLNPRWVETLMGLPIGWVMPSCSRPVITGPTN
jgi:hypothetical protein